MSRSSRLFDLLQTLRRHRRPIAAAALAAELGISPRTIYRDIATLQAQGAPIEGEAGFGYVLKPGFLLPPLMFGEEEVEALVLGLRLVAQRGDEALALAAANAAARINAVLPAPLREAAAAAGLLAGPSAEAQAAIDLGLLRATIRGERKLRLAYKDAKGAVSERVVWPIALAFFDQVQVLAAWCETRAGFRHFRVDRIANATALETRYPRRRPVLFQEWRRENRVPDQI